MVEARKWECVFKRECSKCRNVGQLDYERLRILNLILYSVTGQRILRVKWHNQMCIWENYWQYCRQWKGRQEDQLGDYGNNPSKGNGN